MESTPNNPMKFTLASLALTATLVLAFASSAQAQTIDASGRGWVTSAATDNGNTANNNYTAGNNIFFGYDQRNHFDFAIPLLTDKVVTSATFALSQRIFIGHYGGVATYSLYSVGTYGTYGFSDIGTGTFYGSVLLDSSSNNTTVQISLNSQALADIQADQGGTFSLGGVDSLENAGGFDFGGTFGNVYHTQLILTTATAVPEPGTYALLAAFGLTGAAFLCRRKVRKAA